MVMKMDCLVIICMFQLIGVIWALPRPVFGTKRYQRANGMSRPVMAPAPVPMYQPLQQYYDANGYEPSYMAPEVYDESDESTYYYYPRRHSQNAPRINYRTYGMPTYRGEYKPSPYYYAHGPTYSYYDDHIETGNPLDDLHEEMLQEDERERQRDMMPVGQETWYENAGGHDESLDNVNAAFLRNLIAYNKQLNAAKELPESPEVINDEFDDYINDEEYDDETQYSPNQHQQEEEKHPQFQPQNFQNPKYNEIDDEDVRELKNLAHKPQNHKHSEQPPYPKYQQQHQPEPSHQQYEPEPEYDDSWINWDRKRSFVPVEKDHAVLSFSDRKKHHNDFATPSSTTVIPSTTTATPKVRTTPKATQVKTQDELEAALKSLPGQKEVVLPRPATPVRHPFETPDEVENAISSSEEDKRSVATKDSMYDTIKQLLALQHQHAETSQLPKPSKLISASTPAASATIAQQQLLRLRKRYVTNEESLVQELNGLKRRSV